MGCEHSSESLSPLLTRAKLQQAFVFAGTVRRLQRYPGTLGGGHRVTSVEDETMDPARPSTGLGGRWARSSGTRHAGEGRSH